MSRRHGGGGAITRARNLPLWPVRRRMGCRVCAVQYSRKEWWLAEAEARVEEEEVKDLEHRLKT